MRATDDPSPTLSLAAWANEQIRIRDEVIVAQWAWLRRLSRPGIGEDFGLGVRLSAAESKVFSALLPIGIPVPSAELVKRARPDLVAAGLRRGAPMKTLRMTLHHLRIRLAPTDLYIPPGSQTGHFVLLRKTDPLPFGYVPTVHGKGNFKRMDLDVARRVAERLRAGRTCKEVASELGIHGETVRAIRVGHHWSVREGHIEATPPSP